MSAQMIAELHAAAEELGADAAVRVVVLAGRARVFVPAVIWAGCGSSSRPSRGAVAEAAKAGAYVAGAQYNAETLDRRIAGQCLWWRRGLGQCLRRGDWRDSILMGLTETRLGLIPATIGPYVCARMGEAKARRVFMSGRRFGAAEAVELGPFGAHRADQALDEAVEAEVAPYLECALARWRARRPCCGTWGRRLTTS